MRLALATPLIQTTINHAQYLDPDGGDSAVVIEALVEASVHPSIVVGREGQGRPHRVQRQVMY